MTNSGCFSGILASLKSSRSSHTVNLENRHDTPNANTSDGSKSQGTKNGAFYGCLCQHDLTSTDGASGWESDVALPAYEAKTPFDSDGLKAIESCIDSRSVELRELSLQIHDNPEIKYEEKYAHKVLTEFMSKHGFKVTPHYLGFETAWKATWSQGSGGRTIGFNSEMDALPGIGHACGHNLIAIGGVAAALGVKAALENSGAAGTVVLLGTPAEEGGNGKIFLIERGAYKTMDACLMMHPAPGPKHTTGTGPSLAIQEITAEYFGKTAHASAAPWEGRNALDAAFVAYSAISALRQQIKPTHRVHGIIEGRDWASNIIPDYAKMRWLVRAPTAAEVDVLTSRVKKCFEAAATATSCEVKIDTPDRYVYDLRQNRPLADEFDDIMAVYGYRDTHAEGAVGGSTDFGNVTYELPSLHPSFTIPTMPNGGNHTRLFTDAARTEKAHEICLTVAKGIAATGLRVVTDDEFFDKVKKIL